MCDQPIISFFREVGKQILYLLRKLIINYIFVNCNWVDTRWQQYSTHLHTNNKQNDTKQTIQ